MAEVTENLVFSWWNTGLSPVGRRRACKRDFQVASGIVRKLLVDEGADFLGLGEVTKADLDCLASAVPAHSIYDGTLREGRAQFDTGAIYNAARLFPFYRGSVMELHGRRRLKLANRIDFTIPGDNHPFHLFISHWPSHIVPDSETIRITLAGRLRPLLDRVMRRYDGNARLIIMGDFNEEPFHECLENQLLASRDRALAAKSPLHLYNPFWRHLGESEPYAGGASRKSFAGTCFLRTGRATQWKTVDQIIVSSAFLSSGPWHLNEELTRIVYITPKAMREDGATGIFDHFPVIATIERLGDGGVSHD